MVTAMHGENISKAGSATSKISVGSQVRKTASTARRLTTDKLRELDVIGSLHEIDIFKICVKTLQRSQIAQVLTPSTMKGEDGMTELDVEVLQELCYKAFYRAWAAYSKYLKSQILEKGNAIHCSLLGTFSQIGNLSERNDKLSEKLVCFAPTIDLIHQFGFRHDSGRPFNLGSSNFKEVKYRHIFNDDKLHRVNYLAVAQAAEITETTLLFILRQIFMAVETAMRKDYYVKLNVRVGFLKFKQNFVHFENLVSSDELDKMTHTSCNTDFKNNKWLMTNFKTPRGNTNAQLGEDLVSYKSESLKDTISRIVTPHTPQTKSFHSIFSNNERQLIQPTIGDPNQLNQRFSERKARRLNTIVDGNYGKRMHISGRDKHQDAIASRMLQDDLMVQRIAKDESKTLDRQIDKEDALDIISQIKESLEQATKKKQKLLYRQKNVVYSALQQQMEERQQRKLQEEAAKRKASDFFPFKSDEEFAAKQDAIRRQRNNDMREQLNRSVKEQKEYEEKRRSEAEQQQIEDSRVKQTPDLSTLAAFETGKNVMQEALRRYELKMQKQNAERLKEISDIRRDMEKIHIETTSNAYLSKQKSKLLGKTLESQLEEKRGKRLTERVENKAFLKPHFGPEDPDPHIITDLAKSKATETALVIHQQIKENNEKKDLLKKVRLLEEVRAVKINELVVQQEDQISSEHDRLKKQVLREAWEEQQRMRHEKDLNDYKYYKLLQ